MKAAVDHSDESYKCEKMSDCPYTGTTIINKIPWREVVVGWVWSPKEADQEGGGMMEVRYDVVRDSYFTTNTKGPDREGWLGGVWRRENIERRDSRDMVFLAREGYREQGLIEWRVKVREGEMITRVVLRVESTVSNKGSVRWELSGGDISLTVSPGTELDTNQLAGATQISLQATLLGDWEYTELLNSSRTEERQRDTQLKLLVYFARSGTDQDHQEDRQTEKAKKSDKEGKAGDTQEEDQAEESDSEGERRECCDLSNCCNII